MDCLFLIPILDAEICTYIATQLTILCFADGTFSILDTTNSKKLRNLLQQAVKVNSSSPVDKARRAYAACMDLDKVEELGQAPVLV